MKNIISQIFVLFVSILVISGCSELNNDITVPEMNIVSVHGSGALNPSSPQFHGKLLKEDGFAPCQKCHASSLDGGITGVSCVTCHSAIAVHKAGILNPNSDSFHGKFIQADGWNLSSCASCHGLDYAGGLSGVSCNECHTNAGGPEACNTCHGDFADPEKIAPPTDIDGNFETTAKGVGAHSTHLYETSIALNVSCTECHSGNPWGSSDFVAAHIDGLPAEISFGSIASSGASVPIYNTGELTCANTYCHGNFEFNKANTTSPGAYTADKIVGNNASPIWNKVDGTQAECGTCHGLPPTGHVATDPGACRFCHTAAFNEDGTLNPLTHIDGKITLQ